MAAERLETNELRLKIDPQSLGFERLSQLPEPSQEVPGQDRAISALSLGLRMGHPDFNVYVAGISETGLSILAKRHVEEVASRPHEEPKDWCYVHNFKDSDCPLYIELPKGMGRQFQKDMADLVEELKVQIPQVFEGEAYLAKKEEVIRSFNKERQKVFEELDQKVKQKGFILQADQTGMVVIPAKEDGSPLTPEDISRLTEQQQQELKAKSDELHKEMASAMRKIHQMEKEVKQKLRSLDKELVGQTVESLMEKLKQRYSFSPKIQEYLKEVGEDVKRHMDDFRPKPPGPAMPFPFPGAMPSFTRYEVNLLVDNSETKGAPVVQEPNPSYPNLFGTVERKAQFGALFTDFTMIKPGALHRANGGYLLLKALDLLKRPFSYEALKRCIRSRSIEIEDAAEQFGLFATKALKPQPIPLRLKIILTGDPFIYHLLYNYDDDFRELFKIKAHMDIHVERDQERTRQFLAAIKALVEKEGLRDLDATGAARIVEYSSELSGAKDKLTLKICEIADLLREADYWAGVDNSPLITSEQVQKAIDQKIYRSRLYEDHLQDLLEKDVIKVSTEGRAVGQVNGLSIYDLGDYMFGKPCRITANISLGKEGIVNIEREAELSGKIHTKGVMILAGYLRSNFARNKPLTLTATICFEQSYAMVDGDSASGAELFALLSALSGVSIDQGIAVTGAVSQKGEIIPVGGVTRKIEGFFDLCNARGLTGSQGVIIPKANIRDLMLKQQVIDAVEEKRFHIWAVEKVEDALEILTGMPAGRLQPDGTFPKDTLYYKVDQKLTELAEEAKEFSGEKGEKEEGQ